MENWDRIPKEVWYDKIHFNLKIWTSIYKNSVLIKKKKKYTSTRGQMKRWYVSSKGTWMEESELMIW